MQRGRAHTEPCQALLPTGTDFPRKRKGLHGKSSFWQKRVHEVGSQSDMQPSHSLVRRHPTKEQHRPRLEGHLLEEGLQRLGSHNYRELGCSLGY